MHFSLNPSHSTLANKAHPYEQPPPIPCYPQCCILHRCHGVTMYKRRSVRDALPSNMLQPRTTLPLNICSPMTSLMPATLPPIQQQQIIFVFVCNADDSTSHILRRFMFTPTPTQAYPHAPLNPSSTLSGLLPRCACLSYFVAIILDCQRVPEALVQNSANPCASSNKSSRTPPTTQLQRLQRHRCKHVHRLRVVPRALHHRLCALPHSFHFIENRLVACLRST